jgi:hypothetical protein
MMSPALAPLRLAMAMSLLLLSTACASSRGYTPHRETRRTESSADHVSKDSDPTSALSRDPTPAEGPAQPATLAGGAQALVDGRLRLWLLPPPSNPAQDVLTMEEVRPFVTAFASLSPPSRVRLRLLEVPGAESAGKSLAEPWESHLREEFISRFGPSLLPLPASLTTSRLFLALQLAPLYMHEGIRQAAIELFTSPAFILGVCLSIVVYFTAWLAPEPIFSKAFAAALTVRLALVAGLLEIGQLAQACLRLYREAEASTTRQELEAAARRFAYFMSGTYLRVLVTVATLGVARLIPQVPEGGIWRLLPSVTPEGLVVARSVSNAQVVADGSLIVSGVAASSATCSALAWCASSASAGASGGASTLSTRYGPPHTRQNRAHNEAIEKELAAREAAGHTDLRKNKAQMSAEGTRLLDQNPASRPRFRKPDASSVRPDGIRHNTNYVSDPKDLRRELDAFEAMKRADPAAIHELYMLDGRLVRRHVPAGVQYSPSGK